MFEDIRLISYNLIAELGRFPFNLEEELETHLRISVI